MGRHEGLGGACEVLWGIRRVSRSRKGGNSGADACTGPPFSCVDGCEDSWAWEEASIVLGCNLLRSLDAIVSCGSLPVPSPGDVGFDAVDGSLNHPRQPLKWRSGEVTVVEAYAASIVFPRSLKPS